MSDANTNANTDAEQQSLRDDAGDVGTDRSFLMDLPPAHLEEAKARTARVSDGEEPGSDADAART